MERQQNCKMYFMLLIQSFLNLRQMSRSCPSSLLQKFKIALGFFYYYYYCPLNAYTFLGSVH